MHLPIRLRLFMGYLFVLLIGMSLAAVLAWVVVERLYLSTQEENLIAQAQLTAAAIQDTNLPVEPAEPYLQTLNVMPGIHTRLLSEQGAVVVGLPMPAGDMLIQAPAAEQVGFVPSDELLKRSEIQRALDGMAATIVRRVPSPDGQRVLYAAAPIVNGYGDVVGIVYLATPLPSTRLPSKIIVQFVAILIIAISLAGLTGTILARGIASPIEKLDRAALAVSEGNLNQVVPTEFNITELERLSKSFNEMTASLRHSNQLKNAFIADVTHELRTPLTVIKGTVETLEDGALDDLEGRGPLLESMQRETDRLIRLVNDLLLLTRADAKALNLNIERLNLLEAARSRCKHLTPLAAQRQVALEVVAKGSDAQSNLWALGDADRLAQILDNLFDNAIRYTVEKSSVTATIQRVADEIQCTISDQGPGISPEHLPYVFERFYRIDASRNRQTGGTGLGLAIVHALVSAQGGRISAQSNQPKGASFTFWLPASETAIQLPEN